MSERKRFENPALHNEEEPIKVDMREWKIVGADKIIETTALGPCFGVIIFDPKSKKAIVGHFVDPRDGDFQGMLTEAKKHFKKIEQLKVYVGGGAPDPAEAPEFKDDKAKRKFVKDQLQGYGFQNLKIDYHNSNDNTVLRIDTRTGAVDYDTEVDYKSE